MKRQTPVLDPEASASHEKELKNRDSFVQSRTCFLQFLGEARGVAFLHCTFRYSIVRKRGRLAGGWWLVWSGLRFKCVVRTERMFGFDDLVRTVGSFDDKVPVVFRFSFFGFFRDS